MLGDDVEGAATLKGAYIGRRLAQERMVRAAEIGRVQGESNLSTDLDGETPSRGRLPCAG